MRLILVGLLILFLNNCQSSSQTLKDTGEIKTVKITTQEVVLGKSSKWFSDKSLEQIELSNVILQEGEEILSQVVTGYKNQIGNYKFVQTNEEADITFKIKSVTVKRGRFTFNFLKPGPIYIVKLNADIVSNNEIGQTITKKVIVNMAEIAFPEQNVKWMKSYEKRATSNQTETFQVGLRKLYQNLYFEAFGISLQL